jgi:Lon protease-like protein
MSLKLEQLPLFPLQAVLLPYQQLPIHVFEERYRKMTLKCLDEDRPFGVLLAREGQNLDSDDVETYLVGTSARITAHKTMPDGRSYLLVLGERRFRVRQFNYEEDYLIGNVEPVVELEWSHSPASESLVNRAKAAFSEHLNIIFGSQDINLSVQYPDDPVVLSFAIAGFLDLPLIEKQRLLELTDTTERLSELIPLFEDQVLQQMLISHTSALDEFRDIISNN